MAFTLVACGSLPKPEAAPALVPAAAPAAWQAPLPHDGQLTELARWWQQFNDPVLSLLIESAQGVNPTVAAARSRIEQSRAAGVAAQAALGPSLSANASASRGRPDSSAPLGTSLSAGLQAGWEFDLFGANRAGRDAAQARLDGASASWHDARVSVAAEVASQYTTLRACEAQLAQTQLDATSRAETSRLTGLAAESGFQAPANAALARASAAQGNSLLTQQRAQCELTVKALVALTGLDEAGLRAKLADGAAKLPQPAQIAIARVPADALAQRPDLYSAARDVLAASADVAQSSAQRYPRISLSGSIGAARFSTGAGTLDGTVWSLGPVSVSLPLFDGGTRRANVAAAKARHEEANAAYAAKLRSAVREVEEALITLKSTADRNADAQVATEGFAASYLAAQARYKGGLASLFELEDSRRTAVQAQSALIELQRERVAAWIALYRALGGGWSAADAQARGGWSAAGLQADAGATAVTAPKN
ncbi:MAG: efflux transporter outer membrane subunit [Burkholderiaceae bacterium]|nr:efflux transporter outer membrane subunit [Burkholderiaceae bacterium]